MHVLCAHHHARSIKWVCRSDDQGFVLVQSTGERKLTLNLGKQEWCLRSKIVLSFQTSVSRKSFLVRQPQLAQARVPKDPRGHISAASSPNSAPSALRRDEGSGVLGGLAVFFFFSPRRPVDPMEVKTAYAKL